jgi:hypothetical protein
MRLIIANLRRTTRELLGRRSAATRWIVGGVSILSTVATATYWYTGRSLPFDAARWHEPHETGIRARMAERLISEHRLLGLTQGKVVDLLGSPNAADYCHPDEFGYWLGPERGPLPLDSEWLCLQTDGGGRVVATYLRRD